LLWTAIIGGVVLGYFALTLPDTGELTRAERRPSVTIRAADGSLLTTFGDLFGQPLSLQEISPYLPKAVIAIEDRRFYRHFGIDPLGLLRASFANLAAGHIVQGGSTITQQLAKNLFLTAERSLARKVRETLLALWLEHRFTKNQILEIYLNRVYLGAGTYGVDAAAHRYFGKSARRTTLYESAAIAGLLKAPTRFNPTTIAKRPQRYRSGSCQDGRGRDRTEAQTTAAIRRDHTCHRCGHPTGPRYFADWIASSSRRFRRLQQSRPHRHDHARSGCRPKPGGNRRDAARRAEDRGQPGALVAMSPDGAVRAMVGGRDTASQFNRAAQASATGFRL
jgi:penicillin-binding protein 1A